MAEGMDFLPEELWASISAMHGMGIFWKDRQRRFLGANRYFLDFYGFDSLDAILGRTDEDMGWHPHPDFFCQDELRVLQGETTSMVKGQCMAMGEQKTIVASKRPIFRDGEVVGLMGYFLDMTEEYKQREHLKWIADTDALTEIMNRRSFERELELWFARGIKSGNVLSCLMFDIDQFKPYNDYYGHPAGDGCLRKVAAAAREAVWERGGIIARYGGEEFVALLCGDKALAQNAAERIQQALAREAIPHEKSTVSEVVTVSIGIESAYAKDMLECWDYIANADKALYLAKKRGRNRIIHWIDCDEEVERD